MPNIKLLIVNKIKLDTWQQQNIICISTYFQNNNGLIKKTAKITNKESSNSTKVSELEPLCSKMTMIVQ